MATTKQTTDTAVQTFAAEQVKSAQATLLARQAERDRLLSAWEVTAENSRKQSVLVTELYGLVKEAGERSQQTMASDERHPARALALDTLKGLLDRQARHLAMLEDVERAAYARLMAARATVVSGEMWLDEAKDMLATAEKNMAECPDCGAAGRFCDCAMSSDEPTPAPGIEIPTSASYGKHFTGVIRGSDIGPCVVCGRAVKDTPSALLVHVVDGGGIAITVAEAALNYYDPSGDMGLQPLGSDCLRRHPELRPYVRDSRGRERYKA